MTGPLFDGRAEAAAELGVVAIREAVAKKGVEMVRAAFASSIQNSTGKFDGSVTTTGHSVVYTSASGSKSYSMPVVVDDPVHTEVVTTDLATYGPWLEGTGSRNQTTRFKGYHGFRQASQNLDAAATPVADAAMATFVKGMN